MGAATGVFSTPSEDQCEEGYSDNIYEFCKDPRRTGSRHEASRQPGATELRADGWIRKRSERGMDHLAMAGFFSSGGL